MQKIGQLDQRITLQSYTLAPDGAGGQARTWADFASVPNVWAHVRPGAGGERFEEDRTTANTVTLFTIRYRSDVDERHRIVWNSETYNIRQVKRASNREHFLLIVAERGVSS